MVLMVGEIPELTFSSRDILLFNQSNTDKASALMAWAQHTPGLHPILMPDYHRLQLERWVWEKRDALGHIKMDVGQSETPRRWMGDGGLCGGFRRHLCRAMFANGY